MVLHRKMWGFCLVFFSAWMLDRSRKYICTNTHIYMYVCVLSHARPSTILWTVALQAPLSMEFSRQEYWSGLPFLPPGDLPDLVIQTASLTSLALGGRFFITEPPGKPTYIPTYTYTHLCVRMMYAYMYMYTDRHMHTLRIHIDIANCPPKPQVHSSFHPFHICIFFLEKPSSRFP